jgi:alkanesulfonate monooxygenase SsuD/methylene tetrahydromethanopterin reductase-like flavin-dependent oxidoreductase (luciferase family)
VHDAGVSVIPAPTFGLLAPLSPLDDRRGVGGPQASPADDGLAEVARDGLVDAIWLRDLPVVPTDDDDTGQGTDPFAHLGHLAGVVGAPTVLGTASVILGARHPLVLARAALTVQAQSGGRFILGLGTGGKPAMNAALGVADRTLDSFAQEWWAVRRALRGDVGDDVRLRMPVPWPPPPVYLATTDTERWRAVDGDPEGWLAFAADEKAFSSQHDAFSRISGRPVETAVRFDLTVLVPDDAGADPIPVRGRAGGTIDQLCSLLARWRRMPVSHLLVNVRSEDPVADLRRLREA